ncbi:MULTISPECIES: bile acid:sodium symporter family protein [Gammaproteobacteria]|uniref:bile acid:sodium symporter family protein n=1 Tax=Gammaproteobacteria TaxID=1236 RepID=UPI000DD0799E|nr:MULTISPECIES: bile acid:sodium symporter family protein [Gammaproteobacteria]RTE85940.1 bile acid:sodium symporter family protein [Aliidiomarina sp. B3213]TCZ90061.1 bile acid:sodium symporter family protein [Lysobacter sp. N42]
MLDQVTIEFNPSSLVILNITMALMMFGVSLGLKVSDFKAILKSPKAPVTGLITQFFILPAATFGLIVWLQPEPGLALGMMLVSACPGGSFSNVMTFLARGNVATSVSMTAVSSAASLLLTPLNFLFYANAYEPTANIVDSIALDPIQVVVLVVLVLGIPLLLGMTVGNRFPNLLPRIETPFRWTALGIFLVFVAIAFKTNFSLFLEHYAAFAGYVLLHNALALSLGYGMAKLTRQPEADVRAVTLEVGIQNSGLGLVILFTFMANQGAAILIAAFWGIWHLVSGISLSTFWSRRPPEATAITNKD